MQIRGRLLRVEVSHEEAKYSLSAGERLRILHWNEEIMLEGGSAVGMPIPRMDEVPAPKQPPGREPKLDGGAPAREPEAPSREHA